MQAGGGAGGYTRGMLRYVAATLVAGLVLTYALRSRAEGPGEAPPRAPPALDPGLPPPEVQAVDVTGGRLLTVTQRLAGSVSRASLVYDLEGEERTLQSTSCRRSLESSSEVRGDGFSSQVTLSGTLPRGAKRIRLIVESETGSREIPVD